MGSAGFDIACFIPSNRGVVLPPGRSYIFHTGLFFGIPMNYEVQIRSRSGLAAKHGVIVLNSPGTIDSDYKGEIKIILHNAGCVPYTVENGDRIAQGVVKYCPPAALVRTYSISGDSSVRKDGGFGSTGR
jgi:dUTP pyrophosphatase